MNKTKAANPPLRTHTVTLHYEFEEQEGKEGQPIAVKRMPPQSYFEELVFTSHLAQPFGPGFARFHDGGGNQICEAPIDPLQPNQPVSVALPPELAQGQSPYPHVFLIAIDVPGLPVQQPIHIKAPETNLRFRRVHVTLHESPTGIDVTADMECYPV